MLCGMQNELTTKQQLEIETSFVVFDENVDKLRNKWNWFECDGCLH